MSDILVRRASESDAVRIAALFTEDGSNPYGWCVDRWLHYYKHYPEGDPVSLVAEAGGEIIGHYGMLPIRIADYPAMLGVHAYISKNYRGMTALSALMESIDRTCAELDVSMICGFPNPNFAIITKTFFKWKTHFWLGIEIGASMTDLERHPSKYWFNYSDKWYAWRFGELREVYMSRYEIDDGRARKQLLKARVPVAIAQPSIGLSDCEFWTPSAAVKVPPKGQFFQPFSLRVFDPKLDMNALAEPSNWQIDMGDSDTFVYSPWEV